MTQPSHSLAAVALTVLAALLFSLMDAGNKHLAGFLSLVLVVWSRYTIQAAIMALWLWRARGAAGFRTAHPRYQGACGVLLVAISVLGQPIGAARWLLVLGGFLGTLAVIRPGGGLFGAAALFPLCAMLGLAAYSLLTSRLALLLEDPFTTQFYSGLAGSVTLLPLLPAQAGELTALPGWLAPAQLALLFGIGVLSSIGHLLMVMAFGRAPAATLMPFTYSQIGFAAIMSWLVFAHAPDRWAWTGMALIAVCGGASAWLNLRAAQRAGVPAQALTPETE